MYSMQMQMHYLIQYLDMHEMRLQVYFINNYLDNVVLIKFNIIICAYGRKLGLVG